MQGTVSSAHYGSFQLSATRIKVYDWFWLFHSNLKALPPVSFLLWPPAEEISAQPLLSAQSGADVQRYSTERKGDDPSELFGVREYQEGDRQQRIHWKLSSKMGNFMVKEFSLPIANAVTLVVELSADEDAFLLDGLLELTNTLSTDLVSRRIPHRVCWYRQKEEQDVCFDVANDEERDFMMSELLQSEIPVRPERVPAFVPRPLRGAGAGTGWFISPAEKTPSGRNLCADGHNRLRCLK